LGVAFVGDDGVDTNVDNDQEGKEQAEQTQFAVSNACNYWGFVGKHVVQVTQFTFGAAVHGVDTTFSILVKSQAVHAVSDAKILGGSKSTS